MHSATTMLRLVRYVAIALILAMLGAVAYVQWFRPQLAMQDRAGGLVLGQGVQMGGPFTLTDHTGRRVTDASYRGRWMLIFFGYTHCPDVCPTELAALAETLETLGPLADRVAPLFITVDPERDTPEALAAYVGLFGGRITGLTGSAAEVAAAARAYRVFYRRVDSPDSTTYLMDHSAFIYLMDPDGGLGAVFRPSQTPAEMAATIRTLIERRG